jgi:hypothetical protein
MLRVHQMAGVSGLSSLVTVILVMMTIHTIYRYLRLQRPGSTSPSPSSPLMTTMGELYPKLEVKGTAPELMITELLTHIGISVDNTKMG